MGQTAVEIAPELCIMKLWKEGAAIHTGRCIFLFYIGLSVVFLLFLNCYKHMVYTLMYIHKGIPLILMTATISLV